MFNINKLRKKVARATAEFNIDKQVYSKMQEENTQLLNQYEDKCIPNKKSLQEVEQYILEKYDVTAFEKDSRQLGIVILNVITNYYPEVANRYEDHFDIVDDAQELIKELNLVPKGYFIQNINNGKKLYENQIIEFTQHNNTHQEQIIDYRFEEKTGYYSISNSTSLGDEITLFEGVSQQDIDERNNNLLSYLKALKKIEID